MSQGPEQTTSLAEIKKANAALPPDTRASFFTVGGFDLMQRGARLLASSTLVPVAYRNDVEDKKTGMLVKNPNAMSNCVLALNMAQRIQADPLMIMQNLYIVEGRPGWSSQFIIASINACGKFSPLRFKMEDKGAKEVEWTTTVWEGPQGQRRKREVQHKATIQNKECTAWAIEKATGERLDGPTVSMEMAVQEGWFGKNGSKWQTMPDVMLRYRAASFFGKLYAPELLMGLQSAEEIHDTTITLEPEETGPSMTLDEVKAAAQAPAGETANPETGEVSELLKAPDPSASAEAEADKQARNKERATQIAALSALREKVKVAWEATGAPLEEAEKLVNTFATKWTTAQCRRVQDEIRKRQGDPVPSQTEEAAQPTISCPMEQGEEIYLSACETCPEKDGCEAYKKYHSENN